MCCFEIGPGLRRSRCLCVIEEESKMKRSSHTNSKKPFFISQQANIHSVIARRTSGARMKICFPRRRIRRWTSASGATSMVHVEELCTDPAVSAVQSVCGCGRHAVLGALHRPIFSSAAISSTFLSSATVTTAMRTPPRRPPATVVESGRCAE
jgi:hypothetical protein